MDGRTQYTVFPVTAGWYYAPFGGMLVKPTRDIVYHQSFINPDNLCDVSRKVFNARLEPAPVGGFSTLSQYAASFLLTNDCNLNCAYCYARQQRQKDIMKLSTLKIVVDHITACHVGAILKHGKSRRCHFTFIGGGEPTLAWSTLEGGVNYINQRSREMDLDMRINLVTNGQWLSEKRTRWIIANIDHVSVSMDGDREVQDLQRPRARGSAFSSFRTLENVLRLLKESGKTFGIRATITKSSLERFHEICEYFASVGAETIHVEPVYMFNTGKGHQATRFGVPDPDVFAEEYLRIRDKFRARRIKVYTSLDVLDHLRPRRYCAFQTAETIAVTPKGYLTCCIEVSSENDPEFQFFNIGRVNEETRRLEFREDVESTVVALSSLGSECTRCIARYNCAGGCIRKSKRYLGAAAAGVCCEITKRILTRGLETAMGSFPHVLTPDYVYIDLRTRKGDQIAGRVNRQSV